MRVIEAWYLRWKVREEDMRAEKGMGWWDGPGHW